jgi:hypothetical protein
MTVSGSKKENRGIWAFYPSSSGGRYGKRGIT